MSVKIISYDLGQPEMSQAYKRLIGAIKELGAWAKPLESYWLVDCNKTCSEVRDLLEAYLDNNDRLLVIETPLNAWATRNIHGAVTDWMKRH